MVTIVSFPSDETLVQIWSKWHLLILGYELRRWFIACKTQTSKVANLKLYQSSHILSKCNTGENFSLQDFQILIGHCGHPHSPPPKRYTILPKPKILSMLIKFCWVNKSLFFKKNLWLSLTLPAAFFSSNKHHINISNIKYEETYWTYREDTK